MRQFFVLVQWRPSWYSWTGENRTGALRERAWVLGRRAYFPRLNLGISEDDRLGAIGADSFLKNYSLTLDQLLWDGGRTAENRRVEQAELSLQGHQLERMAAEIAEAALGAYRSVLYTRLRLEIREAALEALGEQRNILRQEVELGLALASDLTGADIAVSEEEVEAASPRMELGEAERELAETLGLTVEFASPWISGSLQGSAGWEPPHDRTAWVQNTLSPLPDPASSLTGNSAELALTLEQEKYRLNLERVGRMAVLGVEKCRLTDRRRLLALKSLELAGEKLRLAELRRELGHT